MKSLLACTGLLIAAAALSAQTPAPKPPPKSPAATESVAIAGQSITITYNSPRVNGRAGHLFSKDGLISHDPHYPVWRAGANPATKLHTDADLTIGDLSVPKGDYTLFVDISDPDNWILIVNKQTGQWGLAYDGTKDLGKTKMSMTKPAETIENLKYSLTGTGGSNGTLTLAWENHIATVPVTVH
jgi:Protein of unknown function (DUF2911)